MSRQRFHDRAEWLRGEGEGHDVVLSSRVRLARNFAGFNFPGRASDEDRERVAELAREHIEALGTDPGMVWVDMQGLDADERTVLVERQLVSKQHAKAGGARGVAVSHPDERLAIMVNEEDHLRIQVIRCGVALREAYEQINDIDDRLESRIDYAFSQRFGYLTACPTNVGTGIRVSVMLHLPALKHTGEMDKVRKASKAMGLAVRGFYGEGSEAVGDFFQLSNQTTLGRSEEDLLSSFERDIVPKVVEYERLARRNLLERRRAFLEDRVWRALGTLRNARLMKADEAMEHLSQVRLGVVSGVLEHTGLTVPEVQQLLLFVQPGHLQKCRHRPMDQAERRLERARLLREALGPEG
ncbi:MAG: protein arginine kinase [Phycisphaerales bacterium]